MKDAWLLGSGNGSDGVNLDSTGGLPRMSFVGYFEGLSCHRSIARRYADRRSLVELPGLGPDHETSDHSSISRTHKRLTREVFDEVFQFVLRVAARKGLLWGEKLGTDSTIQANTSMNAIVRKDSGGGWKDYTKKLASIIRPMRNSGSSIVIALQRWFRTTIGKVTCP